MKGKRLLSGALAILISASALTPAMASADTATAKKIVDAISEGRTNPSHDINGDEHVNLRDALYALDSDSDGNYTDTVVTSVITHNDIAPCAESGTIRFETTIPLASALLPEKIKVLDNLGAQMKAVSVNRLSDTEFTVDFEGKTSGGVGHTEIVFEKGFFADNHIEGAGVMPVYVPSARFMETGGAYDQENELFIVPVSLGSAQLSGTVYPSDFLIPDTADGYSFTVTEIDGMKGDSRINLKIKVSGGSTAEERFDALDEVLTSGGVIVKERSVNGNGAVRISDEYPDDKLSVFHHVRNVPAAYGVITGLSDDRKTAEAEIYLDSVDGEVDISKLDYKFCDLDMTSLINGELKYVDVDYMDSHVLKSVNGDTNCIIIDMPILGEGDTEELMNEAKYALGDLHLHIKSGMLNGWGIEETNLYTDIILVSENYRNSLINNDSSFMTDTVLNTGSDAASATKTALKYVKGALELASKAAAFFAKEAKDRLPGGLSIAGSVVGLISDIISDAASGSGEQVTMVDLKNQLNKVESSVNDISAKVDGLSKQIDAMSKELNFSEEYSKTKEYITTINRVEYAVDNYFEAVKDLSLEVENVDSFEDMDDLVDKYKDQPDTGIGKLLAARNKIISDCDATMELYEPGVKILDVTEKLGDSIIGDKIALNAGKSIFRKYFDCVNSCFNWEPETYEYKRLFFIRVMNAYLKGYNISMAYLTKQKTEAANDSEKLAAEKAIERLTAQMKDVQKTAFGSDEENIIGFADLIEPDRGDWVLNLVTNKVYSKGTEHTFADYSYNNNYGLDFDDQVHGWINWQKFTKYNFEIKGEPSESDIMEMMRRLRNGVTGYHSLYEELVGVFGLKKTGIPPVDDYTYKFYRTKKNGKQQKTSKTWWNIKRTAVLNNTASPRYAYAVDISNKSVTSNKLSLYYTISLDVRYISFNLTDLYKTTPETYPNALKIESQYYGDGHTERTVTAELMYFADGRDPDPIVKKPLS